jgi:1,4-alpha-glucan branching enzyme
MKTLRAPPTRLGAALHHRYLSRDISSRMKEDVVLKMQSCGTDGSLKVTFVLRESETIGAVSVLGSFNDWDPLVHPLKRRSNGTRSVTVEVPSGNLFQFKYLADGGEWFCDPDTDAVEVEEFAAYNSLLRT